MDFRNLRICENHPKPRRHAIVISQRKWHFEALYVCWELHGETASPLHPAEIPSLEVGRKVFGHGWSWVSGSAVASGLLSLAIGFLLGMITLFWMFYWNVYGGVARHRTSKFFII